MTADQFRAWLDQHFPGHDQRGRPTGDNAGAVDSAASYLGISRRSVERKRDGEQPITARDEILMNVMAEMREELAPPMPIRSAERKTAMPKSVRVRRGEA